MIQCSWQSISQQPSTSNAGNGDGDKLVKDMDLLVEEDDFEGFEAELVTNSDWDNKWWGK